MHTSMHNMTTSMRTASSLVYFGPQYVPQKTFVSEDEWTEKTLASEDAVCMDIVKFIINVYVAYTW